MSLSSLKLSCIIIIIIIIIYFNMNGPRLLKEHNCHASLYNLKIRCMVYIS